MKTLLLTLLSFFCILSVPAQKNEYLNSPDGHIRIKIDIGNTITWSVLQDNQLLLAPSPLSLTLGNGVNWGNEVKIQKISRTTKDDIITALFYKKSEITDHYNELAFRFKGDWGLTFRVYNDGVAYRFQYFSNKPIMIQNEEVAFNFSNDYPAIVPYVRPTKKKTKSFENQFFHSFENTYTQGRLSELDPERLLFLPLVVEINSQQKILITEADLENYPGMYLNTSSQTPSLKGVFAPYPKTTEQGGHNRLQRLVTSREPYIAKIAGKRDFPWRVMVISKDDRQLADNDMVYRLASPSRIDDISWIKPGKVAWEWWNDWNIDGVDFISGINNPTYKYYIDFASRNGIEYVILDEGWAVNLQADMMQVIPEINIKELADYASDRNVGIILWAGYEAFNKDMENVCRYYADLGIKGFKVDFLDRDDQEMTAFVYKAAATTARYNMVLDLHGMYKPTGLQRTYPNVLNFEGVHGLENVKWSPESVDQVTYDVMIPFIRMVAGPMDYTQGAMRNAAKGNFAPINSEPMSQGTRCRQLATYIVFESPLNMLCDNPSNYMREKECLDFITQIPVTWDQTRVLEGQLGEKIVIARRKGKNWYIGGLTNWSARDFTLDLSFLPSHLSYEVILFQDGPNAHRKGCDYQKQRLLLTNNQKINIHAAPGGGFALIIQPLKQN